MPHTLFSGALFANVLYTNIIPISIWNHEIIPVKDKYESNLFEACSGKAIIRKTKSQKISLIVTLLNLFIRIRIVPPPFQGRKNASSHVYCTNKGGWNTPLYLHAYSPIVLVSHIAKKTCLLSKLQQYFQLDKAQVHNKKVPHLTLYFVGMSL